MFHTERICTWTHSPQKICIYEAWVHWIWFHSIQTTSHFTMAKVSQQCIYIVIQFIYLHWDLNIENVLYLSKHQHLLIMLTSFVTGYSSWYSTIEIASQELWKTNWNQLWQLSLCSIACARLFPRTILSDCRQFSLMWPIQLHFRLYSVSMHTSD